MSRLPYPKGMRCLAAAIVDHFKLGTAASAIPLAGPIIKVIEHLGPKAVVQWLLEHQSSIVVRDHVPFAGRGRKTLTILDQHRHLDRGGRVRSAKAGPRADGWVKAIAASRANLGCGRDRLAILLQEIERREGLPIREFDNVKHAIRRAEHELKPISPLG